jgi:hypothetical protein
MQIFALSLPAFTLLFVWLGLTPTALHAQRLDWNLEDFKPLTELPWDEELTVPMEKVILSLFREPDSGVRRALLDEYLRAMPAEKLGAAFDLCLQYEGTQPPDDLVEFFIAIWAARDPVACWKRAKELFQVVGIEDGWLAYDGWATREKITVQDRDAIKASRFWLRSQALTSFREGVEYSALPREERARYLREFAETWINAFGTWPSETKERFAPEIPEPLSEVFWADPEGRGWFIFESHGYEDILPLEIAVRRYIRAVPSEAPRVVDHLWSLKWQRQSASISRPPMLPSQAAYQVWAEADLAGMVRWVDALEVGKTESEAERFYVLERVYLPKAMLMGRVDKDKRQQWMDKAREQGELDSLMEAWARFDPKTALDAAVKLGDAEILSSVLFHAACGPELGHPWNTSHQGIGLVRDFDFSTLPAETYQEIIGETATYIMEQWGEVDVGEAARFGVKHLFNLFVGAERKEVLAFFRGESDDLADDGGLLDRTFCALRVWAVTKPDEMKAWIGTLKDEDLRTALTWLAENPWGTGPEE